MQSIISAELAAFAARARAGDGTVPTVLMVTPEQTLKLVVPLPQAQRAALLELIGALAAWLGATIVVLSEMAGEGDSAVSVGLARSGVAVAQLSLADSNVGDGISWLPVTTISPEALRLLPRKHVAFTPQLLDDLDCWFGPEGKCPAVQVASQSRPSSDRH